jgi:hypothetical protein
MPVVGAMYRITQRGRALPNLYRFEGEEAQHCQLHGDYIGQQWLFRKRRNSEAKPWGGVYVFSANDPELQIERAT